MKAFVTGATGFLGRSLLPLLIQRGDTVIALAHQAQSKTALEKAGATLVQGDILDVESMRPGMQGCDVVYHLAGWYNVGAPRQDTARSINVDGTRNVLSLAHELGVPRIIYASTVAVFGDTHGKVVDETYRMPPGLPFVTEYDRTKWIAHYEVALPLIQAGAPIIIMMPGVVFGPGDHSLMGDFMKTYYRGWLPVFPGYETVVTHIHVDDIARGLVLGAERGQPGESYIITGPALSFRQVVPLWAKASGKRLPLLYLPSRFVRPTAGFARLMGKLIPGWPVILSEDAVRMLGVTYAAHSAKARAELGWEPQPLEIGLKETFDWLARRK